MLNILAISGVSLTVLSLILIATVNPISVNAQLAENITDSENKAINFLAVQNAHSGSISKVNTTSYKLELSNVSNNTVLFSDRPERIVESISTSDFNGNWTARPNSFAADPPNTVFVYENKQTGSLDTDILEVFTPLYNMALNTLTYTITSENGTSINLPSKFEQPILVIDTTLNERVQEVLDKLRPFS